MVVPFTSSLLLSLIFLAVTQRLSAASDGGGAAVELWCVAKNNAEDPALQSALDWACGPGAANCGPIQQGGACYENGDIQRTASYAFNDYFLKHGLTDDSCHFDGTAALTSLNPSHGSCKFPSSFTVKNGSFTGSPSTVGIGTSADLNGGSYLAGTWYCWPLITIHLFYAITLVFGGL
ncbi:PLASMODESMATA CALLOSE-BINDING PROTEIN 5-like [Actinidia eriantha]|uniref:PLASMODESMATA CALLOSE-BINDING PROTEIN 5-like n=1 Tax=Actinidia eriantha TaxID=165200 RepID=UPI00258DF7C4|nr:PLASMODESMATA CALLOSE-BINDING PROTEIN 5-like [Actinidia eriantha]